jgi:hypothetical protein
MAIKQPANAIPARCFSLSDIYANDRVLIDAEIKIGITRDWIFLGVYVGLRTWTMVGANKVHEYTLEIMPIIIKALFACQ